VTLIICFVAGILVFTGSFQRLMEHKLDVPRTTVRIAAERERTKVLLEGVERAENLLDTWDTDREGRNRIAPEHRAQETRRRLDSQLATSRADADRVAKTALERLPQLERLRALARVADVVLVVAGAVLMVVSPFLGLSAIL
jgi:hypothetical protein